MPQYSLAFYERVMMDFGSKGWVRIWVHSWALWVLTTCQGYGYVLIGDYGLSPHPQLGKRENYGFKRGYGFWEVWTKRVSTVRGLTDWAMEQSQLISKQQFISNHKHNIIHTLFTCFKGFIHLKVLKGLGTQSEPLRFSVGHCPHFPMRLGVSN